MKTLDALDILGKVVALVLSAVTIWEITERSRSSRYDREERIKRENRQ